MKNGGSITATTRSSGAGGALTLSAGSLIVEGGNGFLTEIASDTTDKGRGGDVKIDVEGPLSLLNGGRIRDSQNGLI